MTWSIEEIELMITDMPRNGQIPSLYTRFEPQRKHLAAKNTRIPVQTIPQKIITSLIDSFQENPINLEKDWTDSEIPYFLWDVKLQHSADSNVQKLFGIPNIKLVKQG